MNGADDPLYTSVDLYNAAQKNPPPPRRQYRPQQPQPHHHHHRKSPSPPPVAPYTSSQHQQQGRRPKKYANDDSQWNAPHTAQSSARYSYQEQQMSTSETIIDVHADLKQAKTEIQQHLASRRVPSAFPWFTVTAVFFLLLAILLFDSTGRESTLSKILYTVPATIALFVMPFASIRLYRFARSISRHAWEDHITLVFYVMLDLYGSYIVLLVTAYMLFWVWGRTECWLGVPTDPESAWRTLVRFFYVSSGWGIGVYKPGNAGTEIFIAIAYWTTAMVSLLLFSVTANTFLTSLGKTALATAKGKRAKRSPSPAEQQFSNTTSRRASADIADEPLVRLDHYDV